jgi:hypothetical protein
MANVGASARPCAVEFRPRGVDFSQDARCVPRIDACAQLQLVLETPQLSHELFALHVVAPGQACIDAKPPRTHESNA